MISKKDFEAIGAELKCALPEPIFETERKAAVRMVQAVATACHILNSRFDQDRFYAACGLTAGDLK